MNHKENQLLIIQQELKYLIQKPVINIRSIIKSFQTLYDLEYYDLIITYIDQLSISPYEHKNLNNIYIFSLSKILPNKVLYPILIKSFLIFKDYDYFTKLKKISSLPVWNKRLQKIKIQLSTNKEWDTLLTILRKEKDISGMKNVLRDQKDWNLLRNHSFYLYELDKYSLMKLLEYYIDYCVKQNFGDEKINAILHFINCNFDNHFYHGINRYYKKNTT